MELERLKNYFPFNRHSDSNFRNTDPEVGFKVLFCEERKELTVKVIGVKQLPASLGSFKPIGYAVKVRARKLISNESQKQFLGDLFSRKREIRNEMFQQFAADN